MPSCSFQPLPPDAAGVVSWVHIGDLHMVGSGEQNHRDLLNIVEQIEAIFANSICFVYIPGDVADDGSAMAYRVTREALDRLRVPWCAILGDHDVHEKSFDNYLRFMGREKHYAFHLGAVHFIALNAFDVPDPGSFSMLPEQLYWLEEQLRAAIADDKQAVLLLHCYPTDLKVGGERLRELVRQGPVTLIDMGHTHYNELANDGRTLYTATRSTGQIEEGPAGFSVTNIDGGVVSWRFVALGESPVAMITTPVDERFVRESAPMPGYVEGDRFKVRAKVWGANIRSVTAVFEGKAVALRQIEESRVWEGELVRGTIDALPEGVYSLTVRAEDTAGSIAEDTIRVVCGAGGHRPPPRNKRDQDNAIAAWPERGVLGTQLGPNKNGRKW